MGRAVAIVIAIFLGLLLIGKCAGSDETVEHLPENGPENVVVTGEGSDNDKGPTAVQGEVIAVPSDPGASYRLLSWSRLANGNLQAITRREGSSGVSYARREIDCDAMTFRYLGEGDTLAEAIGDSPNPGSMAELTPESISTYVSEFVCRKPDR
jgi:hypothetical protein